MDIRRVSWAPTQLAIVIALMLTVQPQLDARAQSINLLHPTGGAAVPRLCYHGSPAAPAGAPVRSATKAEPPGRFAGLRFRLTLAVGEPTIARIIPGGSR